MSDFSLLDEDFDRYVIGFTENHFIPAETNSPTPSEHTLGYNTFALDFAERSNRGELKILQGHSFNLDKKRKQSVSKIHNNILGLMFELSERRKVTTPILSKSAMELYRPNSSSSDISDTSLKTTSSLPLIEVQQLPPLTQSTRSMPSFSNDLFGLPELELDPKDTSKSKKYSKKKRKNEKRHNDKNTVKRQGSVDPNTPEYMRQTSRKTSEGKEKARGRTPRNNNVNETENQDNDLKNVRFTIGGVKIEPELEQNVSDNSDTVKVDDKWAEIDEQLKEAAAIAKKKGNSFDEYRGRYFSVTSESAVRKMSFCQCSYNERAERERLNNVRRRHSSQTNVGPLDFNKLRRQLTIGRSRTMFC